MFYIYYGYIDADSGDESCYNLEECGSVDEVLSFRKEFDQNLHDECAAVIFRVFEGKERTLVPKKVVESYELE